MKRLHCIVAIGIACLLVRNVPAQTTFPLTASIQYTTITSALFEKAVYDQSRDKVYVVNRNGNSVHPFNLTTRAFEPLIQVSFAPKSLDITSDNARLLVANSASGSISSVNLANNVVTPFSDTSNESQNSVAIGSTTALYSTLGPSGDRPREFTLATNGRTNLASLGTSILMDASYDRKFAFMGLLRTSDGTGAVGAFSFADRTLAGPTSQAEYLHLAANYDATVNAGRASADVFVTSRNGTQLTRIPRSGPVAFTWSGKYLLIGGASSTYVYALNNATAPTSFEQVSEIAGAPATNDIVVHPSGNRLFMVTTESLGIIDLPDSAPTAQLSGATIDVYAGIVNRVPVTSTDPDANTRAITAFGLPTGATIDEFTTGADIVFTPTTGQVGETFPCVVFAAEKNGLANSSPQAVTLRVVANSANLSITKTASSNPVQWITPFNYTLTARNNGPSGASNVVVSDTMPDTVDALAAYPSQGTAEVSPEAVIWNVGLLANGASASMVINATANSTGTITNVATIAATPTDPVPSNNTATLDTQVTDDPILPDYTGEWIASGMVQLPRRQLIYGILRVENAGTTDAQPVLLPLYASEDDILDDSDTYVPRYLYISGLHPAQYRYIPFFAWIRWNEDVTGKYLIAAIDPNDSLTELDEENNEMITGPLMPAEE